MIETVCVYVMALLILPTAWQSRALGGADGAEPDPRADHGGSTQGGSGGALVQTHFASGGRLISTASALCPVSSPNFVPRS